MAFISVQRTGHFSQFGIADGCYEIYSDGGQNFLCWQTLARALLKIGRRGTTPVNFCLLTK